MSQKEKLKRGGDGGECWSLPSKSEALLQTLVSKAKTETGGGREEGIGQEVKSFLA